MVEEAVRRDIEHVEHAERDLFQPVLIPLHAGADQLALNRDFVPASAAQRTQLLFASANHNYFNTEWQESDASGCRGAGNTPLFQSGVVGSAKQQTTGLHALMGFFRANVGKDRMAAYNKTYDPQLKNFKLSEKTKSGWLKRRFMRVAAEKRAE